MRWTLTGAIVTCAVLKPMTGGTGEIEEILVQAQRRDQSLQDIPLPVTVLDAEFLDAHRLQRLENVVLATPGFSGWEQGASTPIFALRGISSNSFGIGGEASVGVFVNDTYRGRINSTSIRLVDIEQVEILKGPQGTLFGRNASAGAILIRNTLPNDELSLELQFEAGDNDYRDAQAIANIPILPGWSLRASGFRLKEDGDAENILLHEAVGDRDTRGGQLALRYQYGNGEAVLRLSTQQTGTGGLGYETIEPGLAAVGGVRPDPFDSVLANDTNTFDDVESHDASLHLSWQLREGQTLTSITAWHENDSPNLFDVDGSAIFLTNAGFADRNSETLSQEVRLHGSSGNWGWVGGAIVFDESIGATIELGYSDTNLLAATPFCSPLFEPLSGTCQNSVLEHSRQEGEYLSVGLYADVSWLVLPDLTLGLGLRYSYDDKNFTYAAPGVTSVVARLNATELNPAGNLLGYATEDREELDDDWDDWQPRFYLNWRFAEQHNAFLNAAKGYKAGGFEPAATPALSVFDPEIVWNLDLGVRGGAWQQRLRYQISAFVYDYDDYQVQIIENGIARTGNVDGLDGRGIELETLLTPVPEWTLGLNASWLDAKFKGSSTDTGNLKNNSPVMAPEYSASLSLSWRSPEFSWGVLGASWLSAYQSKIYFNVLNTAEARQGGLYRHNATISYFAPGGNWQVDAFVRNLFDVEYRIFEQDIGAGPVSRRGEPRFLGAALRMQF